MYALLAAMLAGLQNPPVPEDPKLTFQSGGNGGTVIEAVGDLPDRAVVVVRTLRLEERSTGERIDLAPSTDSDQRTRIFERGRTSFEFRFPGLSLYEIDVSYDPLVQCADVLDAEIRRLGAEATEEAIRSRSLRLTGRRWTGPAERDFEQLAELGTDLRTYRDKLAGLLERCGGEERGETLQRERIRFSRELNGHVERPEIGFRRDAMFTASVRLLNESLSALEFTLGSSRPDPSRNGMSAGEGPPIPPLCERDVILDALRRDVETVDLLLLRETALFVPKCCCDLLETWKTDAKARDTLRTLGVNLAGVLAAVRGTTQDGPTEAAEAFARKLAAATPEEPESPEALRKELDEIEKRLRSLN